MPCQRQRASCHKMSLFWLLGQASLEAVDLWTGQNSPDGNIERESFAFHQIDFVHEAKRFASHCEQIIAARGPNLLRDQRGVDWRWRTVAIDAWPSKLPSYL